MVPQETNDKKWSTLQITLFSLVIMNIILIAFLMPLAVYTMSINQKIEKFQPTTEKDKLLTSEEKNPSNGKPEKYETTTLTTTGQSSSNSKPENIEKVPKPEAISKLILHPYSGSLLEWVRLVRLRPKNQTSFMDDPLLTY